MAGKGGAWKVAYADFVTAMMALFMVLWICSQDKEVLIATSRYFQNPFSSVADATSGVLPFDSQTPTQSKGEGTGNQSQDSSNREVDLQFLNSVAKDFFRMMQLDESLADKPIDIQVTSDGLRINLFDRARRPVFSDNTAEFTEWGRYLMQSLAWMIDRHRFQVVIEGHTRLGLDLPKKDYSAWELSADRANASRRALTHYAVDPNQIDRVTGYAATRPLPDQRPDSESNQRVTLSLSLGRKRKPTADESAAPARVGANTAEIKSAASGENADTPPPSTASPSPAAH